VTKVKRLGLIELMREEKDRRDLEATEEGYKLVACIKSPTTAVQLSSSCLWATSEIRIAPKSGIRFIHV
jgi:hypothetical protein